MKTAAVEAAEYALVKAAEAWLRRWSGPPAVGLADTYDEANALAVAIRDLRRAKRAAARPPLKRKAK